MTDIHMSEDTESLAVRLGWAVPTLTGGMRWTRPHGADLYVLVDALTDRLRGVPLPDAHYPAWAQGLTLEQLRILLEVEWQTTPTGMTVVPSRYTPLNTAIEHQETPNA